MGLLLYGIEMIIGFKYRDCPCCKSKKAIQVDRLIPYAKCNVCQKEIEVHPVYAFIITLALPIIGALLLNYGFPIISAIIFCVMIIKNIRFDFFDAALLPLHERSKA